MTARDPAAKLRAARERFVFAQAHGLEMKAAGAELARRRWAAVDARLEQRRCGTRAEPVELVESERDLQWWQR